MTIPVSVVILTQDEAANLPACLDSLAGFDDVHLLDSGSTDATVEVARARGARVHHHPFEGFGKQRNWAIDNIAAKHAWQFHLDADERMTPELAAELGRTVARQPAAAGFFVAHKLMMGDRWLRFAGGYPTYQVRFFHRDRLRFADHGHGQREVTDGPLDFLEHPYLHFAFSKGLDHWFAKHAVYARREAEQALTPDACAGSTGVVGRRRRLKAWSYRLPGRYFFRLLYMLLVKRAFLDGAAGLAYANMLATYEAMIGVHLHLAKSAVAPKLASRL